MAVLTNLEGEVDLVLISAEDGELVKNLTKKPLRIQMPAAFAGVPVLAQDDFGGGGGDFGGAAVFGYGSGFGLNNGGDTVFLKDASGATLSQVTFGGEAEGMSTIRCRGDGRLRDSLNQEIPFTCTEATVNQRCPVESTVFGWGRVKAIYR